MLQSILTYRERRAARIRREKRIRIAKIVLSVIFILIMIKIFVQLKFCSMLEAVLKLETGKKAVVRVGYKDLLFISKRNEMDDEMFIDEMNRLDWYFVERYGNGYVFEKEGEELFVHKSVFLGGYSVYFIENKEYFYSKTSELMA